MTILFSRTHLISAALAAAMAGVAAHAAEPAAILVEGQGIAVTRQDVLGDALRMPGKLREQVLKNPQAVQQQASNLYIYRSLAKMAQAQGMDKQPDVAAALLTVQEKVLADAWLAALDEKSRPSVAAAEAQARSIYQAEPQRFAMEEEVHVRHILIAGNDAQARSKAQEVLKALQGGADFSELARKESADKGSGARGGDLGFFARNSMVKPFEDAAFALKKPGQLSEVVETQHGLHILRLEAHRPAGTRPFEEVREPMVEELIVHATQGARAAEASKLREQGVVNQAAIADFVQAANKAAAPAEAAARNNKP